MTTDPSTPATPSHVDAVTTEPVAEGQGMGGLDLDAIEARSDAATPGPWAWTTYRIEANIPDLTDPNGCDVWTATHDHGCACRTLCQMEVTINDADREFVAHARTDVPQLVAEVRRLTAERDRLLAAVAKVRAEIHHELGGLDAGCCAGCLLSYPCPTIRALDETGL